jgi:hypothetical protein
MIKNRLHVWLVQVLLLTSCTGTAQELKLAEQHKSVYSIVIPDEATGLEQKAATTLQKYFNLATGVQLPVVREKAATGIAAFYIGHTGKGDKVHPEKLPSEGYLLQTAGKDLIIKGGSGKGLIYGVYTFLEKYAGCHKYSDIPATVPQLATFKIPALNETGRPQFEYREVYYPAAMEAEYLEWNKLQRFEDLWGLWGHSYNKLVPAATYFKAHPEYYALVKGKRQPSQLCLTNSEVYKITVADLKKRMAANPDAIYWSVSPNDDIGYCECDKCQAADNEQGGPQGSLIQFVNKIAGNFPDKKITTLAYGYTQNAPINLKPAKNVYILLSSIDALRDQPLAREGSAAAFRTGLQQWGALTPNIFVWDYVTEFTNYLAPFPNLHTLQANIKYLKDNGVKGIFEQGSGTTYSELAELRCYLLTRLLDDPQADVQKITTGFLESYYGPKVAPLVQQYLSLMQERLLTSKRRLDIYGNPVNDYKSFLSPDLIDQYSTILDKAEAAAEGNEQLAQRIMRLRLPLEYTVLQQARFYGIEKFGVFVQDNAGKWTVKPRLPERVKRFAENCRKAGVTELSEGGLTPDQYMAEWELIFKGGVTPSVAVGATVSLQQPFVPDYPAKGNRTLTDGTPGYSDFSYNWLCFYGVPMVATIDMGTVRKVNSIKMHFLDDPRHWIFLPSGVTIEVSEDGKNYKTAAELKTPANEEHFEVTVKELGSQLKPADGGAKVRYIRVTAFNLKGLPEWRYREHKQPMIACDEIFVN